jgi:hypothetical protein
MMRILGIKFLGPKILGKISREKKISIKFFETINGSNIGILVFILVSKISVQNIEIKYLKK